MKKFIEINWFKLAVLLLVIVFYYQNYYISPSELYRLNSDCAKKASLFSEKGTEVSIEQTMYDKYKGICYAEYSYIFVNRTNKIYDITHNKLIVRYDDDFKSPMEYTEKLKSDYNKIKYSIFGN